MSPIARRELLVISIGILIFLALAFTSIRYARSVVRDDLRKQDITNMKRALEQYYNLHEFYVTAPSGKDECTQSSDTSWFFGNTSPLLQEQLMDAIPHDVRESKGFTYSYCVTSTKNKKTTGFYLEAELESNEPEGAFFDEDELRKFDYLVLQENGRKVYRVCGGEDMQCKQPNL